MKAYFYAIHNDDFYDSSSLLSTKGKLRERTFGNTQVLQSSVPSINGRWAVSKISCAETKKALFLPELGPASRLLNVELLRSEEELQTEC